MVLDEEKNRLWICKAGNWRSPWGDRASLERISDDDEQQSGIQKKYKKEGERKERSKLPWSYYVFSKEHNPLKGLSGKLTSSPLRLWAFGCSTNYNVTRLFVKIVNPLIFLTLPLLLIPLCCCYCHYFSPLRSGVTWEGRRWGRRTKNLVKNEKGGGKKRREKS